MLIVGAGRELLALLLLREVKLDVCGGQGTLPYLVTKTSAQNYLEKLSKLKLIGVTKEKYNNSKDIRVVRVIY